MALSGRPGTDQSPTMLGTLAPDEIEELLSTEAVGRIGCIHEGRPYVVPVCYVYQDGAVYGHTTESTVTAIGLSVHGAAGHLRHRRRAVP